MPTPRSIDRRRAPCVAATTMPGTAPRSASAGPRPRSSRPSRSCRRPEWLRRDVADQPLGPNLRPADPCLANNRHRQPSLPAKYSASRTAPRSGATPPRRPRARSAAARREPPAALDYTDIRLQRRAVRVDQYKASAPAPAIASAATWRRSPDRRGPALLARVAKIGDDGSEPGRTRPPARVKQQQELHQVVVDRRAGRRMT